MADISNKTEGLADLLLGSEAIGRGALEGGVNVVASYPGNPSTEITEAIRQVAEKMNIYVEWSINEKVAVETAAAASFAGLRGLSAMKQNGLNVALDFVSGISTSGSKGGLVLVVCDDPSGITSTSEQDSRPMARSLDFPLLEPGTFQEAKDMTRFGLELSEKIGRMVLLRSATRLQHARGRTLLGSLPEEKRRAYFDTSKQYVAFPSLPRHVEAKERMAQTKEICKDSAFNVYEGPEKPDLLIITCGSCYLYTLDAMNLLGLWDRVGILKIGTVWPLPDDLIKTHMAKNNRILVLEEVEPFLEGNLKELAVEWAVEVPMPIFYGRRTGPLSDTGELNPDIIITALTEILDLTYEARPSAYDQQAKTMVEKLVPPRSLALCAGCPHRASYWAIKNAEVLDTRDGFVTGDIGCYSFGLFPSGYSIMKTEQAMGSGPGVGYGFGKLGQFDMQQPVVAVVGDGTFYHGALPALVSAVNNQSNLTLVVLDNGATAMTGFQPHPGTGLDAFGHPAKPVLIEDICKSLGVRVEIINPYESEAATEKVLEFMNDEQQGPRVLIMRQQCALQMARSGKLYDVWVDQDKCVGEDCGCNRYCSRSFKCPGIMWDAKAQKSRIDEAICVGCGVCAQVCRYGAIMLKPLKAAQGKDS